MREINSPLKKNLFANLGGIGVQLLNQIVLVPLYLVFWNINLYGDWIVISAISAFFIMSDIGLNTVSSNRFVISYQKKNIAECNSIINNNYLLLIIISAALLAGCFFYILNFDIVSSLDLHYLNRNDANIVFIFTVVNVLIGIFQSVMDSIYRAVSKNHFMISITNMSRLLEFFIILASLILGFSIVLMVTILIFPKIIMLIYKMVNAPQYFKYSLGIKYINIRLLKETISPSLTFMSFPIGNAIILQGFTIIVNKFFGTEPLILFNTTRTLCNFTKTLLLAMQQSVWPEFSIAYGKGDTDRMRELHQKAFAIANYSAVAVSIFLLLFGNFIYTIWTNGNLSFNHIMMISFLAVLFFENMWTTSSVTLLATNNHSIIGLAYALLSLVAFAFTFIISKYSDISINYIPLPLLTIHLPLIYITIKKGLILTDDSFKNLIKESFVLAYRLKYHFCKK